MSAVFIEKLVLCIRSFLSISVLNPFNESGESGESDEIFLRSLLDNYSMETMRRDALQNSLPALFALLALLNGLFTEPAQFRTPIREALKKPLLALLDLKITSPHAPHP
jgi:hypothetical protein